MNLELRGVSAGYNGKAVLTGVNFSVGEGELLVLAGPNGSGKSTLLKTAGGLLPPLEGSAVIDGREIGRMKPRERAALTAFLFQSGESPWPFTVRETITHGCFARRGWLGVETKADRDAVDSALFKADLTALADRQVTSLSGGELQRVNIARCIAQGAAFFLFDEPENNLDPKYAYTIMTLLTALVREGKGAIVSLHDLRLASRFAQRVALLSLDGAILLGTPGEVLTAEKIGKVYDMGEELVRELIL